VGDFISFIFHTSEMGGRNVLLSMTIVGTKGGEAQGLRRSCPHISNKLWSDQTAHSLGPQVLQLETATLHHQLHLLLLGTGCLLPAQHVL
jgi:hypothetical protein